MEEWNDGMGATYVNSFWLKLCSQYQLRYIYIYIYMYIYIYYVLFNKILQGGDKPVGLFFIKGVVELVVKTLDIYTHRVFKNYFQKLKL